MSHLSLEKQAERRRRPSRQARAIQECLVINTAPVGGEPASPGFTLPTATRDSIVYGDKTILYGILTQNIENYEDYNKENIGSQLKSSTVLLVIEKK
ncbi:hypothetical protein RR46_09771 [Papilio xuthus]|uniref:Uncharacterized protein n=1 Tax=Papilio xuthus TaxID=66420 RepID=A0A194QAL0_PAPXU|nr:hypothetical protein RR46_09771 [Papilio xuthus]